MKEGSKGGKKGNSMGGKKGYSMGGKKENSKGGMKVLEKKVMEGRPVEVAESYFDLSNCSRTVPHGSSILLRVVQMK